MKRLKYIVASSLILTQITACTFSKDEKKAPAEKLVININDEERKKLADSLLSAIQLEDVDAVKKIVGSGADVHYENENGETALIVAIQVAHPVITKYLLDQGAAPYKKSSVLKMSAYDLALDKGLQKLLNFMEMTEVRYIDQIELLLQKKEQAQAISLLKSRYYPGSFEPRSGLSLVDFLLDAGFVVSAESESVLVALIEDGAGFGGVVGRLLKSSDDLNLNALSVSVFKNSDSNQKNEIVKLLNYSNKELILNIVGIEKKSTTDESKKIVHNIIYQSILNSKGSSFYAADATQVLTSLPELYLRDLPAHELFDALAESFLKSENEHLKLEKKPLNEFYVAVKSQYHSKFDLSEVIYKWSQSNSSQLRKIELLKYLIDSNDVVGDDFVYKLLKNLKTEDYPYITDMFSNGVLFQQNAVYNQLLLDSEIDFSKASVILSSVHDTTLAKFDEASYSIFEDLLKNRYEGRKFNADIFLLFLSKFKESKSFENNNFQPWIKQEFDYAVKINNFDFYKKLGDVLQIQNLSYDYKLVPGSDFKMSFVMERFVQDTQAGISAEESIRRSYSVIDQAAPYIQISRESGLIGTSKNFSLVQIYLLKGFYSSIQGALDRLKRFDYSLDRLEELCLVNREPIPGLSHESKECSRKPTISFGPSSDAKIEQQRAEYERNKEQMRLQLSPEFSNFGGSDQLIHSDHAVISRIDALKNLSIGTHSLVQLAIETQSQKMDVTYSSLLTSVLLQTADQGLLDYWMSRLPAISEINLHRKYFYLDLESLHARPDLSNKNYKLVLSQVYMPQFLNKIVAWEFILNNMHVPFYHRECLSGHSQYCTPENARMNASEIMLYFYNRRAPTADEWLAK